MCNLKMEEHREVSQIKELDTIPLFCEKISGILHVEKFSKQAVSGLITEDLELVNRGLDLENVDKFQMLNGLSTECERVLKEKSLEEVQYLWEKSSRGHYWSGIDVWMLVDTDGCQRMSTMCQITARLEWVFGQVVKRKLLLKDNLLSDNVSELLGEDLTLLFRWMIGDVQCLNMKNLLWHGFVSEDNIPRQFSCLLFALLITLNRVLNNAEFMPQSTRHDFLDRFKFQPLIEIPNNREMLLHVISTSPYIHPRQRSLWHHVLIEHFVKKKYFASLSLNIVVLQHVLRRMWVLLSGCSTDRASAQCDEFYITFDEMFSPAVEGKRAGASYYSTVGKRAEPGKSNVLVNFLGIEMFHALLDLFVHADGPRLRDKLSHGEVHFIEKPALSKHVLFLSISILLTGAWCDIPDVGEYVGYCKGYIEQFHPVSIILQNIDEIKYGAVRLLKKCSDFNAQNDLYGVGSESSMTDCFTDINNSIDTWVFKLNEYSMKHDIDVGNNISTLFVTSEQVKSYNALKNISKEILTFSSNLELVFSKKSEELKNHTLRSRQRVNLRKLVFLIPAYCRMLDNVTMALMIVSRDEQRHEKYLKAWLKCFENCCSLSLESKWTNVSKLLVDYMAILL